MPDDLALRVVLKDPPRGYAFCLQRGKGAKSERLDYVEAADADIVLELSVAVRQSRQRGLPQETQQNVADFGGPFVQGPRGGRFFYVCVGRCSMVAEPQWEGRVKVPLGSISWALAGAALAQHGLEASYAASRPDGRPAYASVALLGEGWRLR